MKRLILMLSMGLMAAGTTISCGKGIPVRLNGEPVYIKWSSESSKALEAGVMEISDALLKKLQGKVDPESKVAVTGFANRSGFNLLERSRASQLRKEREVSVSGYSISGTGADIIVTGSYGCGPKGGIQIAARAVEVSRGTILGSAGAVVRHDESSAGVCPKRSGDKKTLYIVD